MNLKDATIAFNVFFSGPKALQSPFPARSPFNSSTSDPDPTVPTCEFWVHPLIFGTLPLPPTIQGSFPGEHTNVSKTFGEEPNCKQFFMRTFSHSVCLPPYDTALPVPVNKTRFPSCKSISFTLLKARISGLGMKLSLLIKHLHI